MAIPQHNFFPPPPLYDLLKLEQEAEAARVDAKLVALPKGLRSTELLYDALEGNLHHAKMEISRVVRNYKRRVTRYLGNMLDVRDGELAREEFTTLRVLEDHLLGYRNLNDAVNGVRNGIGMTRMSLDSNGRAEPTLEIIAHSFQLISSKLRDEALTPVEALVDEGLRAFDNPARTGTPEFRINVDHLNVRITHALRDSLPQLQVALAKEQAIASQAVETDDGPATSTRPSARTTTIEVDLTPMTVALGKAAECWDDDWAYSLCRDSRRAHEAAWRLGPAVEFVRDKMIPVFALAAESIRKVPRIGPLADSLEALALNVDDRRVNLVRYTQNVPSAFAADDRLRMRRRNP